MILRILLRGGGLGGKFLLVIAISNVLGLAATSIYGITVALSVVASKAFGVGASIEVNRQLSAGECGLCTPAKVIGSSMLVAVVCAAASLRVLSSWIPRVGTVSALVIISVCVTEYLSYETTNLVYSVRRADLGAFLLFIKSGAWACLACLLLWAGIFRTMEQVLLLWVWANTAVALVGLATVAITVRVWGESTPIRTLLSRGFPFYVSAIVLSLSQYMDRFVMAKLASAEDAGRYVLCWSVANVVQALTYAVVSVVAIPDLARWAAMRPAGPLVSQVFHNRWVIRACVAATCFYVAMVAVLCVARLAVPGKVSSVDLGVASLVGAAFVLRSVHDVVVGGLVAFGRGRIALLSSILLLVISAPLYWGLVSLSGGRGAALGVFVAATMGLAFAYVATQRDGASRHAS